VGRYIVLEKLGGGGMGVVYAAYDPELDRKIAIKLVRASAVTEARDRLLREAQAMARLQHPNVIAVHDVGLHNQGGDDEVFIAMELVDGAPLSTLIKEQRPAQEELLSLFMQAGRGLAAAHAAGIIHRDFKPDNVLVGQDGRVRVLDFGLARAAGEGDEKAPPLSLTDETEISGRHALATPLTRTGAFMGTPAYMAPEQMLGKATDARTDQFSFCVALYEALYGARPFAGETVMELAHHVLNDDVQPVPKDSQVAARLRAVLLRGLKGKPEERFPSMEALLDALAPRERPMSPVWWAALGVVLLGAGVLGFRSARRQPSVCRGAEGQLASVWDAPRKQAMHAAFSATGKPYAEDAFRGAERALDGYAKAWAEMHTSACEATRLRGEQSEELLDLRMECLGERREEMRALVDLFTRADAQVVEKAVQAASTLGGLDGCANTAVLKAPVRLPSDPAKRARIDELRKRLAMVKALHEAAKYSDGLAIARLISAEARTLGYAPIEAEALLRLGELEWSSGSYQEAETTLFSAAARAMAGRDDAIAASVWTHLTHLVGWEEARPDDALRWAQFAEAAVSRAGTEELRAKLYVARSSVLLGQRRYEEALDQDRRALAIRQRTLGSEHPEIAQTLGAIGLALNDLGRTEEALATDRQSLAIFERMLGPEHPDVAKALNNLGAALNDQGRYEEALPQFQRALQIFERALGPEHPLVGVLFANVADALAHLHKYDEALVNARRALEIVEKALGPQHPDLGYPLQVIGKALVGSRKPEQAIAPLERALAVWQRGENRPKDQADVRFDLAKALWGSGDRGRAIKMAQAAREGYSKAEPSVKEQLNEVEAWLELHRAP
jgi:tetratricopeptide (TPR) repeat protein/tRNA A-37 threonylcarbamoyl transferase component Bud32